MQAFFHEPYPARAVIKINGLPKRASVEIEATMAIMQKNEGLPLHSRVCIVKKGINTIERGCPK